MHIYMSSSCNMSIKVSLESTLCSSTRGKMFSFITTQDGIQQGKKEKIQGGVEIVWSVLLHPPHSPDLAQTDYYLFFFWPLQNVFMRENFFSNESQIQEFIKKTFHIIYSKGTEDNNNKSWQITVNI